LSSFDNLENTTPPRTQDLFRLFRFFRTFLQSVRDPGKDQQART